MKKFSIWKNFKKFYLVLAIIFIIATASIISSVVSLSAAPVNSGDFTVDYNIQSSWGTGATVNVKITNNGPTVQDWAVKWTFSGDQKITNMWNAEYTQSGSLVSAKNNSWNGTIPTNGSQSFGFNINYSGDNSVPSSFTVSSSTITNVTTAVTSKSPVTSTTIVTTTPPKSTAIATTTLPISSSPAAESEADGFAQGTTGGKGGSSIIVSNKAELQNAVGTSSKMIITVSGNIDLGSDKLSIKSDKTLQGKDSKATITGNLCINNVSNVIVKNITITNPNGVGTGDGIEVSGSNKVFITKCTLIDNKDGAIDIVRASDYVTVSWCRFRYPNQTEHSFANLIGNGDDATGDRGKLHVTMHHNWYDTGCIERMPRVRFGQVHCYNNYYGSNATNYVVGVGVYSEILLENCYFANQSQAWKNYSSSDSNQGKIQWNSGNEFVGTSIPSWAPNSNVFDPTYSYSLDKGSNVKSIVTSGAGNI